MVKSERPEFDMERISIEQLRPGSNVRKEVSQEEVDGLAQNLLAIGQLHPIVVGPPELDTASRSTVYVLVDGWRRYLAAKAAGIESLMARVLSRKPEGAELAAIQVSSAIHAQSLTPWELFQAISELLSSNPGWTQKKVAELLGLKEATLSKILAPCKCTESVVEAFRAGKIGASQVYEISKAAKEEQAVLLEKVLSGATRDQIHKEVRRSKKPAATDTSEAAVKVHRIELTLPNAKVTVLCELDGLDRVVELLNQAVQHVKWGKAQNMSPSTLMRHLSERWKDSPPELN